MSDAVSELDKTINEAYELFCKFLDSTPIASTLSMEDQKKIDSGAKAYVSQLLPAVRDIAAVAHKKPSNYHFLKAFFHHAQTYYDCFTNDTALRLDLTEEVILKNIGNVFRYAKDKAWRLKKAEIYCGANARDGLLTDLESLISNTHQGRLADLALKMLGDNYDPKPDFPF